MQFSQKINKRVTFFLSSEIHDVHVNVIKGYETNYRHNVKFFSLTGDKISK